MSRKNIIVFILLTAVVIACQLTQSLQLSTLPGQTYWAADPSSVITPTYRIGTFFMNSDINIGGPDGIILRVTNVESEPNPNNPEEQYYYVFVTIKNYTAEPIFVPISDLLFIRRVIDSSANPIRREWTSAIDPLVFKDLPSYDEQLLLPDEEPDRIAAQEERNFVVAFILPKGVVEEIGLATDLQRTVNSGLPIWIYPWDDPDGPFIDPCGGGYTSGCYPPPPTPVLLDDSGTYGGVIPGVITPPAGLGLWPTNGYILRGYGCEEFYTGVDGAGFGCPPEKPWFHNGVDVANVENNPIYSPIDGTIEFASFNPSAPDCSHILGSQPPHQGLGNYQRITDGATLHYLGHLSGFVLTGGAIGAGEFVSLMGSTGCSTGSHLHWIVYDAGVLVDPSLWAGPGPPP